MLTLVLLAAAAPAPARAANGGGAKPEIRRETEAAAAAGHVPPRAVGLSFNVDANASPRQRVKDGGELAIRRESLSASYLIGTLTGLALIPGWDQEWSQYEWRDDDVPELPDQLTRATVTRASLNARWQMNTNWSFFAGHDASWSVTGSEPENDGQTYGGLVSVRRRFAESLSVSLGLIWRTRLEDQTLVLPIPGIDWNITPRLSLRTAQGATLTYQPGATRRWLLDTGLNYERREYRLEDGGRWGAGVLRDQRLPWLGGLTYQPNPGMSLRGYVGCLIWQRFELQSHDGESESYSTRPGLLLGLSARLRF